MKLPKPIKIGAHLWQFKRMLPTPGEDAPYEAVDFGSCEFDNTVIWLSPKALRRGGSFLAETVLHEVQHAVNWIGGVADGATEEHFTTQSAMGWTQVWADNPHLLDYVRALLHPEAAAPRKRTPQPAPSLADPARPSAPAAS